MRKEGAGHEADVDGTDHCYSHEMVPGVLPLARLSTRSRTILLGQYGSRDRCIRSLPFSNERQANQFRKRASSQAPLKWLLILALFCQKSPDTTLDCIERELHLTPNLPASSAPSAPG